MVFHMIPPAPLAVAALLLAALAGPADAAPAASAADAPDAPASTPLKLKPPPRPMSPLEKAQAATAPGTLRPERPVVPQISIPLGRRSAEAEAPRLAGARRAEPVASTAPPVDDAAARCEALAAEAERNACRIQLRRVAGPPRP